MDGVTQFRRTWMRQNVVANCYIFVSIGPPPAHRPHRNVTQVTLVDVRRDDTRVAATVLISDRGQLVAGSKVSTNRLIEGVCTLVCSPPRVVVDANRWIGIRIQGENKCQE